MVTDAERRFTNVYLQLFLDHELRRHNAESVSSANTALFRFIDQHLATATGVRVGPVENMHRAGSSRERTRRSFSYRAWILRQSGVYVLRMCVYVSMEVEEQPGSDWTPARSCPVTRCLPTAHSSTCSSPPTGPTPWTRRARLPVPVAAPCGSRQRPWRGPKGVSLPCRVAELPQHHGAVAAARRHTMAVAAQKPRAREV